ncbi:MAG: sigma-54 dependent transcriptional regulator [bacterium]
MNASHKILIVEDDPSMQATLSQALEKDPYNLFFASNFKEGQSVFESENPDAVLLDINLPDRSGRELFSVLKKQNEEAVIIILTAFPELRGAISLMKAGAFDYLVKPFDLTELKMAIRKGLEIKTLKNEVIRLKRKERDAYGVEDIIGVSDACRRLREDILLIAAAGQSTVLITGESGTGKELVAQAIHYHSPRADGPLMAINCSAIPETLVESELFGHEKGAFTNAIQTSKGVFELANGGTLFLDEIGELPLGMQPKLLRALETHRIKRVGGSREIPIDIRLVSATNKNLGEAVGSGEFREDLFYRVNVIPLDVPPIRERVEDIRPLVEFITEDMSRMTGLPPLRFSPDALLKMETYSWPGNVREMRNLVERLVILHGNRESPSLIGLSQLPEEIRGGRKANGGGVESGQVVTLEELERRHIFLMMERFKRNKSEVSRQLGISRNTLKDKLNKYGLSR